MVGTGEGERRKGERRERGEREEERRERRERCEMCSQPLLEWSRGTL